MAVLRVAMPPPLFVFAPQESAIDFAALSALDVPTVRSTGDVAALQPFLSNLLYSRFTAADAAAATDDELCALVGALQSACEYMVYVQLSLGESLASARAELVASKATAANLPGADDTPISGTDVVHVHRCPHCIKAFRSVEYLSSHLRRKHGDNNSFSSVLVGVIEDDRVSRAEGSATALFARVKEQSRELEVRGQQLTEALAMAKAAAEMAAAVTDAAKSSAPPVAAEAATIRELRETVAQLRAAAESGAAASAVREARLMRVIEEQAAAASSLRAQVSQLQRDVSRAQLTTPPLQPSAPVPKDILPRPQSAERRRASLTAAMQAVETRLSELTTPSQSADVQVQPPYRRDRVDAFKAGVALSTRSALDTVAAMTAQATVINIAASPATPQRRDDSLVSVLSRDSLRPPISPAPASPATAARAPTPPIAQLPPASAPAVSATTESSVRLPLPTTPPLSPARYPQQLPSPARSASLPPSLPVPDSAAGEPLAAQRRPSGTGPVRSLRSMLAGDGSRRSSVASMVSMTQVDDEDSDGDVMPKMA